MRNAVVAVWDEGDSDGQGSDISSVNHPQYMVVNMSCYERIGSKIH